MDSVLEWRSYVPELRDVDTAPAGGVRKTLNVVQAKDELDATFSAR